MQQDRITGKRNTRQRSLTPRSRSSARIKQPKTLTQTQQPSKPATMASLSLQLTPDEKQTQAILSPSKVATLLPPREKPPYWADTGQRPRAVSNTKLHFLYPSHTTSAPLGLDTFGHRYYMALDKTKPHENILLFPIFFLKAHPHSFDFNSYTSYLLPIMPRSISCLLAAACEFFCRLPHIPMFSHCSQPTSHDKCSLSLPQPSNDAQDGPTATSQTDKRWRSHRGTGKPNWST